jgi:hypothetical protein
MTILDPLRSPIYESGGLIQQCENCHWAQRGHKRELTECPLCGESLAPHVAIAFGGIGVVYRGKDFDVITNNGGFVTLQENDVPEIVQFICKHARDRRTGAVIRDFGIPRRVEWQRSLSEHLFRGRGR